MASDWYYWSILGFLSAHPISLSSDISAHFLIQELLFDKGASQMSSFLFGSFAWSYDLVTFGILDKGGTPLFKWTCFSWNFTLTLKRVNSGRLLLTSTQEWCSLLGAVLLPHFYWWFGSLRKHIALLLSKYYLKKMQAYIYKCNEMARETIKGALCSFKAWFSLSYSVLGPWSLYWPSM